MHLRNLVAIFVAAAFLAACNIGMPAPVSHPDQNAIETAVQLTLQAGAVTPFISPAGPATGAVGSGTPGVTPSASPSVSPTVTKTPSADKPMLSITGNSNCRTGPGASFQNVTGFTPGTELEIVGRYTPTNFWLVKIPGSTETCWVWGEFATAKGNVKSVPETTPVVPTALALPPTQPGALFYAYECTNYNISVTLSWSDKANNEKGYRVYRGDSQVADLPANSASYDDTVSLAPPQSLQYSVVAYNDNGESSPSRVSFTACP